MNELDVYKRAYGNLASQIAGLTANLELAHTQIDILNEQLKELKEPKETNNSDKEKGSE